MTSSNQYLNYRVSGNGRPVLFLHGFLESNSMWEYLPEFQEIQRIEIELPGHGSSDAFTVGMTLNDVAQKVIDTVKYLKLTGYDVVGHSMGGYVALALKALDANCEKVILLNSNFWTDSPQKQVDRVRVAELVQTKKEQFVRTAIPNLFQEPTKYQNDVENLINQALRMDADSIGAASLAMSNRKDFTKLVHTFSREIFIIQGIHDTVVSIKQMKPLIAPMRVNYLEIGSGHMAHIEATQEVHQAIENFLK